MALTRHILRLLFILLLLFSLLLIIRHPHEEYYHDEEKYVYSAGNAPEGVRSEILVQLAKFQEGYTQRDLDHVDLFVEELFSKDNTLVIGTMPDEIYIGSRKVSKLVYADWNAWGDCTFLTDTAHISSADGTAWFSTIGYVRFDVPSFLVLPLRLTGVMVKEDLGWKFQFMQFQFDLTIIAFFLTAILLTAWLIVNLITLIVQVAERLRNKVLSPEN